jgi:hypothetical protein
MCGIMVLVLDKDLDVGFVALPRDLEVQQD